jgi:hypothetical protein
MDADGSNKRRLTDNGATNWAPSWHPDGERVVFSSNMDDWREDLKQFGHNFELYLINIDGSGLEPVDLALLGNSITLTPGTLTLDVHEGRLLVHALTPEGAAALERGEMQRRVAALRQR